MLDENVRSFSISAHNASVLLTLRENEHIIIIKQLKMF